MSRLMGIVLAGGASSRLGRDKAAIRVQGQTILARTVTLLRGLGLEVAISGRDPGPLGVKAPWFEDLIPGIGPMGGVAAALERFAAPCLCLSCDLPLLTGDALSLLIEARERREPGQVVTTFHDPATGYVQSLVAVYEPEALSLFKASIEKGVYKLFAAIKPHQRLHVPCPPDSEVLFLNVNTPEDLARLRELESDPGPRGTDRP